MISSILIGLCFIIGAYFIFIDKNSDRIIIGYGFTAVALIAGVITAFN